MIEATILMHVIPGKREELRQTLRSMTKDILREAGCTSCKIYQDVDNENIFRLIEEWNTREDLDNHLKNDMFGALIGTKSLLVEPADIKIFAVSYAGGMEVVKNARGRR